jgi:hypothetical protein
MYAISAPKAWIASIESPELILPPTIIMPSKISLTSETKAKGDKSPVFFLIKKEV